MEVRALGDLEVVHEGQALELGSHQQRAVLAILALSPGKAVSSDRLIEALWGQSPPASAAKTIQVYISRLRKVLGVGDEVIATVDHGYALRVDPRQIDVRVFERLLDRGRRAYADGEFADAADVLRDALALWRGAALADFTFDAFASGEIARLEELRLEALETRIDADLALGRHAALIAELKALTVEHPLRERLRAARMLSLYRCGREPEALALYRQTRELLVDELGIEPSPALRDLHAAILRQDPALAPPAMPQTPLAAGEPAVGGRRRRRAAVVVAALALAGGVAVAIAALAGFGSNAVKAVVVKADAVGVIDPTSDHLKKQIDVGPSPSDVLSTPGAVWVSNADGHSVTRIDAATGDVRQTIPVGSGPAGLALAGGAVWVANTLDGTVSRIDPATNTAVQTTTVGDMPTAIAAAGGAVWVANSGEQTLSRIDPLNGHELNKVPVGAAPTDLIAADGSLWMSSEQGGSVSQLDPHTGRVENPIGVGGSPSALTAADGSVWAANPLDGTVTRIDADSGTVTSTITVGNGPDAIVAAPDGVWVSNQYEGTVDRIDPHDNDVKRRITVGNHPTGVALVNGALWVGVRSSGAAHRGGTLTVVAGHPLSLIDPANAYEPLSISMLSMTNDGLVAYQHVSGAGGERLVPDLAVSLPHPTDGGRAYRFVLRRGIHYSTGAPVRVEDVRATFERLFKTPHSMSYLYTGLVGAGACLQHPGTCDLSRGITTDARHSAVTFHLTAPDPDFPNKTAASYADILPAGTPAREARTPLPATGPYMISSYRRGHVLRLVRNRRFHEWSQAAQPDGYPDAIVFRTDLTTNAAITAVERGDADDFGGRDLIPASRLPELITRYTGRTHIEPTTGLTLLSMNTRARPFNDVRVRRALNYALDRRALARVWGGRAVGAPTCQILPANFPGYQRYCPYHPPQLRTAQRLVDASGTRGSKVTVSAPPGMDLLPVARYAASVLRRLGYQASAKALKDFFPAIAESGRREQIGAAYWAPDYPAASDTFATLLSCKAFVPHSADNANWAEFCDPKIDALMGRASAAQLTDPEAANRLWALVDRRVVDAAPWVPVLNPASVEVVSKRVGDYRFTPQYGSLLDQLWVH